MKLYTMVGIPASGKSTFTNTMPDCVIISTDGIRKELYGNEAIQGDGAKVFALAYKRIEEALQQNKDVIFDATNVSRKTRKNVFRFKAEHIAVFCNTPLAECLDRNNRRNRKVPQEVIKRMYRNLTPPTTDEGFSKIIEIF